MKSKSEPRRYTQGARAQAAEATGQRIVEAFLARLMEQWYDEITLARVAEEAGVTVQTIVRRFGDKEGLLSQAVRTLNDQIGQRRGCPIGDVHQAVEHLLEDYEQVGDGVIRLLALESRYQAIAEILNFGRGQHRAWVEHIFSPSLAELNDGARRNRLDALVVVTDVYTWKLLRRDMQRSLAESATLMENLVHATLSNREGERP